MHISCEKCSTTYMLDERVLPPAGAPVQCTRCGHVFTARPPAAASAPAPASVHGTQIFGAGPGPFVPPAVPPARSTTQVFGAPASRPADPPAPVAAPRNPTQLFGKAPGAAEPAGSMRQTQVFGAVAADAPAPAKPTTQLFGQAPAHGAPAPADDLEPPARSTTQMFGAVPSIAAAEPTRSTTQMFGAVPSLAAAEPARSTTQMFGSVPAASEPVVAPPARSTTQMFGSVPAVSEPVVAPPARSSTQMFGAVPSIAPAEPARNATQMFGSVPAGSAPVVAPPRSSTQMFGSVPAAGGEPVVAPPARSSTQMFGSLPAASEPVVVPPARSTTQMFGSGEATAAPPPRTSVAAGDEPLVAPPARSTTQMFGSVPAASEPVVAPPARSSTQMFGSVPAASEPVVAPPARSSTQMFGSVPAASEPVVAPPARSSTQMFGAASTQPSAAGESLRSTQVFGTSPPARSSTQMFGAASDEPSHGAGESLRSTQIFGGTPHPGAGAEDPRAAATDPGSAEGGASLRSTQIFGAGAVAAAESGPHKPIPTKTQVFGATSGRGFTQTFAVPTGNDGAPPPTEEPKPEPRPEPTRSPAVAAVRRAPVELPPDEFGGSASEERTLPDDSIHLQAQLQRRNRTALMVVGLLALGIITFVGVRAFLGRSRAVPEAWTAAREQALSLLRRDDAGSRRQALEQLGQLVKEHPAFTEARADHLLALALALDDASIARSRIQAASAELNRRIKRLQDAQSPSDWANRANALREELIALDKKDAPLGKELDGLRAEVAAAVAALSRASQKLTPAEQLSVMRAEAVYSGVAGKDEALGRSKAYELQGPPDGWGQIAYAEYALNTKSPPETLRQAREQMEALRESDRGFLRPYVLSARLALALKQYDEASSALEAVKTMNASHAVAAELLEWVQESSRGDAR